MKSQSEAIHKMLARIYPVGVSEDELLLGLKDDASFAEENVMYDLKTWKKQIQTDAESIWMTPESIEVGRYVGYDPKRLSILYTAKTFIWILGLLKTGVTHTNVQRVYVKSCARACNILKDVKEQMRQDLFFAAMNKYHFALQIGCSDAAACFVLADKLPNERESNSLSFQVLRERPNLIGSSTSQAAT